MKKLIIIAIVGLFSFCSCSDYDLIKVKDIYTPEKEVLMKVNTQWVDPIKNTHVIPSNATEKGIYWTSSDPNIVEIFDTGAGLTLYAHNLGDATITAISADGGYKVEILVHVLSELPE